MRKSLLHRLEASPIAKMVLAAVIFCLVVGGWVAFQAYRQATAQLPDDKARSGPCSLWFVGSSSIRRWTSLDEDMAPWIAHNRGINDATFADILPRLANSGTDRRPAAIILYSGENDIAQGIPVRTAFRGLAHFLDMRSRMMGDVPVIVLSVKPSPTRWPQLKGQQLYSAATRKLIPHVEAAYYADITTPLLVNGKLGDNYQPDGVHMNRDGYRIWARVIRQRLKQILPPETLRRCDPGAGSAAT